MPKQKKTQPNKKVSHQKLENHSVGIPQDDQPEITASEVIVESPLEVNQTEVTASEVIVESPLEVNQTEVTASEVIVESPLEVNQTEVTESEVTLEERNDFFFQAITTLYGKIVKDEELGYAIRIGNQLYRLFIFPSKYRGWLKQIEKNPDAQLYLRAYPKYQIIPKKNPEIYFQVVAWGEENQWSEPGIYLLRGIWQFVPQVRTPVISVYRNRGSKDQMGKFKATHLPILMKREDEATPFRFNPKINKEDLPPRWFIQAQFKFIPSKACWGWVEDLEPPTKEIPRYKKPVKVDPKAKTEEKADPKAKTEEKADPKAKTEVKVDPKAKTEVKADPKVETEVKADPKVKTEVKADPKAKTEVKADPKVETEVKADPKVKTEVKADPKVKTEVKADPKVETEVKADPKAKTEVKADPKVETEVKADPKVKTEVKADPKVKTEVKKEIKKGEKEPAD